MRVFPRLVYKSASVHLGVNNEAEYEAALSDGWHDSVPDALKPKAAAPVAVASTKRDPAAEKAAQVAEIMADLRTKDEAAQKEYGLALGVKFDKKMDAAAVLDAIEKALNAA